MFYNLQTPTVQSPTPTPHTPVTVKLALTILCADHQSPAGSWACVRQAWPADCFLQRSRQLKQLRPTWRVPRRRRSGPSERSSPHWRRSSESSLCPQQSPYLSRSLTWSPGSGSGLGSGSGSGRSAAAASLWQERQERKWTNLEGSASAGPSCTHWGGWPQSYCLTGAGEGSSW